MGVLRDRMEHDIVVRGLSANTQRGYLFVVTDLARYHRRSPGELSDRDLLAQWATEGRQAGSLLTFFEPPWPDPNFAAFDSCFYEDISYTQVGRFALHVPEERHLHLLAHMGSATSCTIPSIRSVADALPFGIDYRAPYAVALVGDLDSGAEIVATGFDPGTGTYGITAASVAASACGAGSPPCYEAVLAFDTQGGSRGGAEYRTPAILLSGFPVADALVSIEVSTDGGSTFAPLSAKAFNLTGSAEEAALGAGRRLFQYLGTVPSSATGANAFAFRFLGPVTPPPPPPASEPCAAAPIASGCRVSSNASLKVTFDGGDRNKLAWKHIKGTTPVEAFGDPAAQCGNGFALCAYDSVAGTPALSVAARVDGGGTCSGKPCWKRIGSTPTKGFKLKDPTLARSGVLSLLLRGGKPSADKVTLVGKGATLPLPPPATPSQYFRHAGDVVVQLVSDDGECWESRFAADDVRTNDPGGYEASFAD